MGNLIVVKEDNKYTVLLECRQYSDNYNLDGSFHKITEFIKPARLEDSRNTKLI